MHAFLFYRKIIKHMAHCIVQLNTKAFIYLILKKVQ